MTRPGGAIEIQHLTKTFGTLLAVDDLSFRVAPGTVAGFLGPNGAGKTTTLRVLFGLVSATSGTATIGGLRYAELADPLRVVGAALEATGFHPARRARDHLRMLCATADLPSTRADEVLDTVGLADAARRRVRGFSLGMRQRLALATALLGDPGVLVLDEPANGLDPAGVTWLRTFLRDFAARGGTVLVSSHALAEVAQTVDEVVIIAQGRLIRQGRLDELTSAGAIRVRSPRADELRTVLADAGALVAQPQPTVLIVSGVDAELVSGRAAAAGIPLLELTADGAGLERIFMELTEGKEGVR
jgi:ABC-2 type transport system ATP-binding protein